MARAALTLLFCLALSLPLGATTFVPLSFEQLVNESASIVYGRVVDVRAQWGDDRRSIESVVTLQVIRGMKGGISQQVAFTVPGGQVGRYINVIPGTPSFAPGDLAVVFLTARGVRLPVTTGLTQGVYRVRPDASTGELRVMPPVIDTPGRIVRGDLRRQPVALSAFETSVKSAAAAVR